VAFFTTGLGDPAVIFRLIAAKKGEHSIKTKCRLLGVALTLSLRARSDAARSWASSMRGVQVSRAVRNDVLAGVITLSVRLWKRP
jgi:hypothetical protein